MKRLITTAPLLATGALLSASAYAHHSMSMFDMSKVEVIEGKIAKLDWTNPHMYLTVETKGPDGKPALIEGEGLGITQAAVDGLKREDLKPGTPVVVRINPNRSGWGKQVRVLDVTTQDGEIHPFYAANTRTRVLTPATSIAGHWAPNRASTGAAFGAMAAFPLNADAKAVQAKALGNGLCYVEPAPFGAVLDELRTIDVGKNEVVMKFDNTGDHFDRVVHMTDKHPADVKPTQHGPLHRPVGRRHARGRHRRLHARPVRPRRKRAVGPGEAHRRAIHADSGQGAPALRDHGRRPDVSHGAGHVDAAVGPPPRSRVLAGHGYLRSGRPRQVQASVLRRVPKNALR